MRALLVLGVLMTVIVFGFLATWAWDRLAARRVGLTDSEARGALRDMTRLLDHALADPMYRQSSRFEERAQELVGKVYGRDNIR